METKMEEQEINLLDLFFYLKKKIWLIVAAGVVMAALGVIFTAFFVKDTYTADTRMYVLNRASDSGISSSDYSVSNYMIKDYEVLITGENVAREVISTLNLNMSVSELTGKISVSAIDSTRVLQITVVDTQAQRAADIANCVREVSGLQIKKIMDVDAVNLVYEAEVPQHKSGPSTMKNMVLAAVGGVVVVIAILVVCFLLDDTIRTDEDVTRYLDLGTLGVIPASAELEAAGSLPQKKKKNSAVVGSKPAVRK